MDRSHFLPRKLFSCMVTIIPQMEFVLLAMIFFYSLFPFCFWFWYAVSIHCIQHNSWQVTTEFVFQKPILFLHVLQENGYQLLFLSARAISQAYHTRQFLFNLKQVRENCFYFLIWSEKSKFRNPECFIYSFLLKNIIFHIFRMERLCQMGQLLFPLMDFFLLSFEKVFGVYALFLRSHT